AHDSRSPGWQSRASQSAASVEKRTALARPFFRTDRFTTVTSTSSASCVSVSPLASSNSSRCTATPCSDSEAMSDRAFQVVAQADAGGEDLGEHEGGEATNEDVAGQRQLRAGAVQS